MAEEKSATLITPEIRALIGREADPVTAFETVEPGALRRFCQAIMDDDPVYWNAEYAKQTRYGGVIAPPLYSAFSNRRRSGTPDPLDRFKDDPDWDGTSPPPGAAPRVEPGALPPVNLPLQRLLNGGVSAEFFAYSRPGDRITGKRKYIDISERTGRTGLMVIILTETAYTNQDGLLLCKVRNTTVRR